MLAIDIHTHAFHPRIAARAVASLERTYGLRCQASGLLADLERQEQAAGIDRYALLCAATSASQVVPANNYAIEVHGSDAGCGVAFGTLHPGFAKWEAELDRLEPGRPHGIPYLLGILRQTRLRGPAYSLHTSPASLDDFPADHLRTALQILDTRLRRLRDRRAPSPDAVPF